MARLSPERDALRFISLDGGRGEIEKRKRENARRTRNDLERISYLIRQRELFLLREMGHDWAVILTDGATGHPVLCVWGGGQNESLLQIAVSSSSFFFLYLSIHTTFSTVWLRI